MPWSFFITTSKSTVSNAFEKSANAIRVISPFFIALIISSLTRKRTIVVECPLRKPATFMFNTLSGADPEFFLPTSKENLKKITGEGMVVRYGFGNLFDFNYLFKYLRKPIRNIST